MASLIIPGDERWQSARKEETVVNTRQLLNTAVAEKLRDVRHVGTITNAAYQKGAGLDMHVFMTKLRRLNPELSCVPNKNQPGFAAIYLNVASTRLMLMPCQDGYMPEWSVMDTREERDAAGVRHKVPGREVDRGWRTILARLIKRGIIGQDATEREFGTGDRLSWAVLLGKQTGQVII